MDIVKIIALGFITLIFTIVLKQYKKEFAIYAVIVGGALILLNSIDTIKNIIDFLNDISGDKYLRSDFIKLLLKITGISILCEYAISICKDSGESAIANKIDLGGKIIVISMSIPVISTMLNGLLALLA